MKKSEKLLLRLKEELGISVHKTARIERTGAGHWQRAAGAWLWEMIDNGPYYPLGVGSQWTVTQLLAAPKLVKSWDEYRGTDIDPEPEPRLKKRRKSAAPEGD